MGHYRQLTLEERYQISALLELGIKQEQIALKLNRPASTISRELGRNTGINGYDAKTAQRLSDTRRRTATKANKRIPEVINWVNAQLLEDWSPEQISGSMKEMEYPLVSHEWIYQHILRDKAAGGALYLHLRHKQGRYRRRYGKQDRRGKIVDRVGIEERPLIVDERERFGDWEGDSIVGSTLSALVTLLERKSGIVMIRKVERSTAKLTSDAMIEMLRVFENSHTVTVDNGKEFAHHKAVTEETSCPVYFARPYHSWERGANENVNGLIRQYFPKGTNFDLITEEQIKEVQDRLNLRPRKRLGFKAPIEFVEQLLSIG